MEKRKIISKSDWLFFALILLTVLALTVILRHRKETETAIGRVYLENELLCEIDLHTDQTFSLPDYPQVILEVRDGSVRFLASDCPDQICVQTGFIRSPGQFAVCLPYRLLLRVEGADEPDAVTGCLFPEVRL